MRLILATLLAVAAFPAAALAAPTVTTGPADPIGQTTATLTGTVDPDGSEALYHFEYGTSDAYGVSTIEQTAGSGSDPVAVTAALGGLSPSTTYHYRLVVGEVKGDDRTFKTAAAPVNPSIPGISSLSARDRTATSARLTARIDPNRAATTYFVEWGTSSSLGRRTPDQTLVTGDTGVAVSIPVDGLLPYRRVYWRVVATNAAGVKRSGTANFTTLRAPTGITASISAGTVSWSDSVTVFGTVQGGGVSGMTVALEQGTFPFGVAFTPVATALVDSRGDFRFRSREVLVASRFRVVTQTTPAFTSAELSTLVRPRISARVGRRKRRSARIVGTVNPALADARVTLQRQTRSGGWTLVRRSGLRVLDQYSARFGFWVRRSSRPRAYRVIVAGADDAFLRSTSRTVLVARRRR